MTCFLMTGIHVGPVINNSDFIFKVGLEEESTEQRNVNEQLSDTEDVQITLSDKENEELDSESCEIYEDCADDNEPGEEEAAAQNLADESGIVDDYTGQLEISVEDSRQYDGDESLLDVDEEAMDATAECETLETHEAEVDEEDDEAQTPTQEDSVVAERQTELLTQAVQSNSKVAVPEVEEETETEVSEYEDYLVIDEVMSSANNSMAENMGLIF